MNTILFVDAYDSFSRNIIALLYSCITNAQITTIHIDTHIGQDFGVQVERFLSTFDAIVLGPGPGDPRNDADIGLFKDIWKVAARQNIPVLGICLGFQSLCLHFGLSVTRMREPCHGQTKHIRSDMLDVFEDLSNVVSMNYNSLGVRTSEWWRVKHANPSTDTSLDSGYSSDSSSRQTSTSLETHLKSPLQLLAWDDEGYAMTVRHPSLPLWGFQFHPESCMSNDSCHQLIRNWWSRAKSHNAGERSSVPRANQSGSRLKSTYSEPNCTQISPSDQTESASQAKFELQWVMLENNDLNMSDLSSYCHDTNNTGTIAILESSAKGRYCIYSFTDDLTKIVSYSYGQLVRGNATSSTSVQTVLPSEALKALEDTTKSNISSGGSPDIPFWGGFIGYISYEMCLEILPGAVPPHAAPYKRKVPEFEFVFVQRSIVFDKTTGSIYIQSIRENDENWIETTRTHLLNIATCKSQSTSPQSNNSDLKRILDSTQINLPDHDTYISQIQTCQSHLRAGNSYELCLTTEATITTPADDSFTPYLLYRNLNKHNPVPFASYLHFPILGGSRIPSTTILSTSPEQFLSWSRTGTLDMIPMKGTVARLTSSSPSLAEATTILRNPKESAENLMIADLIRHDLHGVVGCKPYTSRSPVEIVKLNEITPYATVYQLTSHIRAHPPPSLDPQDVRAVIAQNHSSLLHTLPPGSMTGAPKRRSCQFLREIEQRNRGAYSGVIGYMDVGGGGCWSVAIRTAWSSSAEDYEVSTSSSLRTPSVSGSEQNGENAEGARNADNLKFQKWHIGAGGAITVLSDADGEWEEMMGKLRSVLKGFRS